MRTLKPIRLIGAATLLASAPVILAVLLAVFAYAQSTPSPQPAPGQVLTPPAVNPGGAGSDVQKPAVGVTRRDKSASETPSGKALVGLPVFGSDGQNVGQVTSVKAKADGEVSEIHVKVGGLLGFGARVVAIPAGKFANAGQNILLAMTTAEVGKLPAIDEKRG